jgi:LmbE family N-acetylglucosaminyl deacetylase
VKAGWQVDLLCAPRGEAGVTGTYGDVSKKELGQIREAELEKAAGLLGISSVVFMDHIDGTLHRLHHGELEESVYKVLAVYVPDAVITFETNGISNHPDHIKLSYATTFAFQKYAKELEAEREFRREHPERTPKDAPVLPVDDPRLYYACLPESIVSYLVREKALPSESFGKPWVGTPDKFITTVINTRRFAAIKKKALQAHETQAEDVNRFLSAPTKALVELEHFILRMQGPHEVFFGKNDRVSDRL